MPRDEYVDEHQRLVRALETKEPKLLASELEEQRGDLEGAGITEDKRMINAKSPWTLAHLNMKVLQGFYNNPAVPPSMKTKLKNAMMMKPTLKKSVSGGLSGVSKASGFIRRLMWENKNKHKGDYKNPTWGLAADSKMSSPEKFDWKKLASKDQGGEGPGAYGASPFISHHFEGAYNKWTPRTASTASTASASGDYDSESKEQKAARSSFKSRGIPATVATSEIPMVLQSHFGNIDMGTPPVGIEVKSKEPEPEPAKEEPPAKEESPSQSSVSWTDIDTDDYSPKEKLLARFAFDNPKGKLSAAISILKENKETGIAPGTISPILARIKTEIAKQKVDIAQKKVAEADFARRSEKIKGVLKKQIPLRKLRKEAEEKVSGLRYQKEKREREEAEKAAAEERETERKAKREAEQKASLAARKAIEDEEKDKRTTIEKVRAEYSIKAKSALASIVGLAKTRKEFVVINPFTAESNEDNLTLVGTSPDKVRKEVLEKYKGVDADSIHAQEAYLKYSYDDYRKKLADLKKKTLSLRKEGDIKATSYKDKPKHNENLKVSGKETSWEKAGTVLADAAVELGFNKYTQVGRYMWVLDHAIRPNSGFRQESPPSYEAAAYYEKEEKPRMTAFLKAIDDAIAKSSDADLDEKMDEKIGELRAQIGVLKGAGKPAFGPQAAKARGQPRRPPPDPKVLKWEAIYRMYGELKKAITDPLSARMVGSVGALVDNLKREAETLLAEDISPTIRQNLLRLLHSYLVPLLTDWGHPELSKEFLGFGAR